MKMNGTRLYLPGEFLAPVDEWCSPTHVSPEI